MDAAKISKLIELLLWTACLDFFNLILRFILRALPAYQNQEKAKPFSRQKELGPFEGFGLMHRPTSGCEKERQRTAPSVKLGHSRSAR